MFVQYNGIDLEIEHVTSYEQHAVYDPSGVDFLYMHHRLVVRCVWNPEATANDDGDVAALSMGDLRQALLTPRKLLLFQVPNSGGTPNNLLTSPLKDPNGVRYSCDANNGPKPLFVNIANVCGQKTMVVDFAIETWVLDCTANRPIISHRWEMSNDIDSEFFTTRTINGVAIFRTDWLNRTAGTQYSPDQFRGYLFHPVPNNYQRTSINVQLSSDNTSLRYRIVDQEQYYNILPIWQDIVKIDVTLSKYIGQGEISTTAAWAGGATGAVFGAPLGPAGSAAGAALGAAIAGATLPKVRMALNVRVQGRRRCSPIMLGNAVTRIMASLNFGPQQTPFGFSVPAWVFHTSASTISLTRSYLETNAVSEASASTNALQRVFSLGPQSGTLQPPNGVFTRTDGPTANPGGVYALGNSIGGNRESLRLLVAQMLSSPCAAPAEVLRSTLVNSTVPLLLPS